jgi:hypothetical protein
MATGMANHSVIVSLPMACKAIENIALLKVPYHNCCLFQPDLVYCASIWISLL